MMVALALTQSPGSRSVEEAVMPSILTSSKVAFSETPAIPSKLTHYPLNKMFALKPPPMKQYLSCAIQAVSGV